MHYIILLEIFLYDRPAWVPGSFRWVGTTMMSRYMVEKRERRKWN